MWGCSVAGTVSRDYGAVRRSINSLNFGQHYSMISARSFDINNLAFKLASKLAWNWRTNRITLVPCQFLTSSMTAPGYYQVTTMAPGWILKLHTQKIGLNYAIVPAKFRRKITSNYCATRHFFFTLFQHLERQPNRPHLHHGTSIQINTEGHHLQYKSQPQSGLDGYK